MTNRSERLSARPTETPEQQRERLLDQTIKEHAQRGMKEWRAFPLEKRDDGVRTTYGRMLEQLKTLHAAAPSVTRTAREALAPLLESMDSSVEARLEEIFDAVEADIPETYGDEPENHPYLSRSELSPLSPEAKLDDGSIDPDAMLSTYSIDNGSVLGKGSIRTDITYVRSLLQTVPANSPASNALSRLIVHLEQMRLTDPRNAVAEMMSRLPGGRGDTYMDKAGKEMGRVGLTGFLLAGTVIFGAISIAQFIRKREVSFAPILWGVAMYIMADPALLKSFFGKDARAMKEFEQINRTATNTDMLALSRTYGIGGNAWGDVVERFYEMDDHRPIMDESRLSNETILNTINELSGEPPLRSGDIPPAGSIRGTLKRMFDTKDASGISDFRRFARAMLAVEGDDARAFMATYIRNDAFRHGTDIDPRVARALKEAAETEKKTRS